MVALNRQHIGFGTYVFLVFALIPWFSIGCRKQEPVDESPKTQSVEPPPAATPQEVKIPQAILDEILGRWRIVKEASCGVSMDQETTDLYIGKTVLIEPRLMVFKDHKGDDCSCRFTDIKASVRDTDDYLTEATGCAPGYKEFVKIKERKVRVLEPEPDALWKCAGTPFSIMFKPNPETLVIRWNGVFFFMERDTGTVTGKEHDAAQSPAPEGLVKR